MTRTEHLLWILAEECAEVAQRASKAARFGLSEIQPEQEFSNAERIGHELSDLIGVVEMLQTEPGVPPIVINEYAVTRKREKIERFLEYSAACGTLIESEGAANPVRHKV